MTNADEHSHRDDLLSPAALHAIMTVCRERPGGDLRLVGGLISPSGLDPVAVVQAAIERLELGPPKVRALGVPFEALTMAFRRSIDFDGTIRQQLRDGGVAGLLAAGATVIVNRFDRADPGLFLLVKGLRRLRLSDVCANAYLSAANARSFGWHADSHDVVVVQISGSKRWHFSQDEPEDRAAGEGLSVVQVTAGDVLRVPRGLWHRAETTGEGTSLHLSLALFPLTVDRLVAVATEHVMEGINDDQFDLLALTPPQRQAVVARSVAGLGDLLAGDPFVSEQPEQDDVNPFPSDEAM